MAKSDNDHNKQDSRVTQSKNLDLDWDNLPVDDPEKLKEALQLQFFSEGIEKKLESLAPDVSATNGQRQNILIGIVSLFFLLFFLYGLLTWFNYVPSIFGEIGKSPTSQTIKIDKTSNGSQILFLLKQNQQQEARLLDVDSGLVLDISKGSLNVKQVAFNSTHNAVAIASADMTGPQLTVLSLTGGAVIIFEGTALSSGTSSSNMDWQATDFCDWSEIYWSPNNEYIAFFGCSKVSQSVSALYLVKTENNSLPKIVSESETELNVPRTASWIDESRLVYTQVKNDVETLYLYDLSAKQPIRLFGP